MAKTNHINYTDMSGQVYCYRYDAIVELTEDYVAAKCGKCPYFAGSAQGDGVECLYNDGSNQSAVQLYDPYDAQEAAHLRRDKLLKKKAAR